MKTIRQNFAKLLALTLLLTLTISCEQMNRNSLEKEIEKLNRECPQKIEGMGTLVGGEVKGDMVFFKYKLEQENFDLLKEGWKAKGKDESAEATALNFVSLTKENNSFAKVIKQIIDAGCGLTLQFFEDDEKDKVEIAITKEQFQKAKEKYADATPEDLALKAVINEINTIKAKLPMQVDEITQLIDYQIQEPYVVMTYELDDDSFDFKALEAQKDQLKKDIFQESGMSTQMMGAAFANYRKAGLGLKYIYKSKNTGKSFEIKIESNELPQANENTTTKINKLKR